MSFLKTKSYGGEMQFTMYINRIQDEPYIVILVCSWVKLQAHFIQQQQKSIEFLINKTIEWYIVIENATIIR